MYRLFHFLQFHPSFCFNYCNLWLLAKFLHRFWLKYPKSIDQIQYGSHTHTNVVSTQVWHLKWRTLSNLENLFTKHLLLRCYLIKSTSVLEKFTHGIRASTILVDSNSFHYQQAVPTNVGFRLVDDFFFSSSFWWQTTLVSLTTNPESIYLWWPHNYFLCDWCTPLILPLLHCFANSS